MKLNRVEGKCYSEWLRWGIFIYPISVPKPTVPSPLHFFSLNPCPVIDFCSAVLNKLWFSDSGMKLELCGFTRIVNYSFKLFRCSLLYPWTIKKPECQRIDAFELWYWRRLLRVPRTARRSNQSTLKEISPGCSLEGMMLKLKLQYFGHFIRRVDSLEKTLMLGGIGGRRRGRQRMRRLDGTTDSMDMSLSELRSWWWTRRPGVL